MSIELFTFYVFAAATVFSAIMVVVARHPVHAVLFLILAFFNAAGLFLLMGAEFLAMILVIVYVGAVAVLFLFVVMMLDVDFAALKQGFLRYLPVGGLVGGILLVELMVASLWWSQSSRATSVLADPLPSDPTVDNTLALGKILYTDYFLIFQLAGLILLTAMIGAIVLTFRERIGGKRQNISDQVARSVEQSVEMHKIMPGRGVVLPEEN